MKNKLQNFNSILLKFNLIVLISSIILLLGIWYIMNKSFMENAKESYRISVTHKIKNSIEQGNTDININNYFNQEDSKCIYFEMIGDTNFIYGFERLIKYSDTDDGIYYIYFSDENLERYKPDIINFLKDCN